MKIVEDPNRVIPKDDTPRPRNFDFARGSDEDYNEAFAAMFRGTRVLEFIENVDRFYAARGRPLRHYF